VLNIFNHLKNKGENMKKWILPLTCATLIIGIAQQINATKTPKKQKNHGLWENTTFQDGVATAKILTGGYFAKKFLNWFEQTIKDKTDNTKISNLISYGISTIGLTALCISGIYDLYNSYREKSYKQEEKILKSKLNISRNKN